MHETKGGAVSGRDMLAALLGGEQDPEALAELARGKVRAKLPALRRALVGRVKRHHLVLISRILAHLDFLSSPSRRGRRRSRTAWPLLSRP
jgi:hypothetical protein